VYEPAEDTFLLLKLIDRIGGEFSLGLDMGCGTGIAGLYALYKGYVRRVVFTDINPYAVNNTVYNLMLNRFEDRGIVIYTDRSNPLREDMFDIVFSNPPYLPGKPRDIYDESLVAGVKGYKKIIMFIDEAFRVLRRGGYLLLIFSSLSHENIVFKYLIGKGFRVVDFLREHYFFEDIIGVGAVKI
jgi:release factor glutamine methyltransferase